MLKTVETIIGHWVTFIKAHERLATVGIIALVAYHYGNQAYDAYGQHLKAQVNADNARIVQIEQDNAKQQATLTAMIAELQARIQADEVKIANAKQTIIIKQQQDDKLALPELSQHWQSMLSLPDGSITPQSNNTVSITAPAAHATVNELEKIGPLSDQLSATQDELKSCNDVSGQKDTVIAGLKSDVAEEKKGRIDDAKLAAQEKHKSFWNGTKFGAGLVFVAELAIKVLK